MRDAETYLMSIYKLKGWSRCGIIWWALDTSRQEGCNYLKWIPFWLIRSWWKRRDRSWIWCEICVLVKIFWLIILIVLSSWPKVEGRGESIWLCEICVLVNVFVDHCSFVLFDVSLGVSIWLNMCFSLASSLIFMIWVHMIFRNLYRYFDICRYSHVYIPSSHNLKKADLIKKTGNFCCSNYHFVVSTVSLSLELTHIYLGGSM